MEVQIDDWKVVGGKYVNNGARQWGFGPAGIASAICGIIGGKGIVWHQNVGQVQGGRKTTPCDDLRATARLEQMEANNLHFDNTLVNNCRNFARGFYGFGINGFQGKKQEACCNPDGTKWEL